jgi:hypothetical protein
MEQSPAIREASSAAARQPDAQKGGKRRREQASVGSSGADDLNTVRALPLRCHPTCGTADSLRRAVTLRIACFTSCEGTAWCPLMQEHGDPPAAVVTHCANAKMS